MTSRFSAMFAEPWRLWAQSALHALITHTSPHRSWNKSFYTRIIYYKPCCNVLFNGSNWMTDWFARLLDVAISGWFENFLLGSKLRVWDGTPKTPSGVQGKVPVGVWGRSPPEAEAFWHLWNTIVHNLQLHVLGGLTCDPLTDFLVFSRGVVL